MLTACPNCATSYGVDMASLRLPGGRTRQLRCRRCHWLWQAELCHTERLEVAADAMAPVRRALAAAKVAAGMAPPWSIRTVTAPSDAIEAASVPPRRSRYVQPSAGTHGTAHILWAFQALAARCAARWKSQRLPRPHLQLVILGLLLADTAIIGWRAELVSAMPQMASFYARLGLPVTVRGLNFDHLTTAAERHDSEPVLIVKGEISNNTNRPEEVPPLRLAVRNAEHQEIYFWTAAPDQPSLAPGETMPFRSELALPPPDTRDVVVRFERDDDL
jgi:predicted Zn finger-like uncharacterized protein